MTKNILLLAAVLGFIAQSSVFAADPTPSPSMSPKATPSSQASQEGSRGTFAFSNSQGLLRATRWRSVSQDQWSGHRSTASDLILRTVATESRICQMNS